MKRIIRKGHCALFLFYGLFILTCFAEANQGHTIEGNIEYYRFSFHGQVTSVRAYNFYAYHGQSNWTIITQSHEDMQRFWETGPLQHEHGCYHITYYNSNRCRMIISPVAFPCQGDDFASGYLYAMYEMPWQIDRGRFGEVLRIPYFNHVVVAGDWDEPFFLPITCSISNIYNAGINMLHANEVNGFNEGYRYTRSLHSRKVTREPWEYPFNCGYLAFQAKSLSMSNYAGIKWPGGFEWVDYEPSAARNSSNDLRVVRRAICLVTNVVLDKKPPPVSRESYRNINIADVRVEKTNKHYLVYRTGEYKVPTLKESLAVIDARRELRQRQEKKRITPAVIVILIIAAPLFALGKIIIKRKEQ